MLKTIITQNGDIINLGSLFAIFIDASVKKNGEKNFELNAVGAMGQTFVIGTYSDEEAAVNAKADIIRWLQNEAFSTFDLTAA